jgi:hypothetical protein
VFSSVTKQLNPMDDGLGSISRLLVMRISKLAKSLESVVIWTALLAVGHRISWKNVQARQLVGAEDDARISLDKITLSNGELVLAHLKEREFLLVERRRVTREKASVLVALAYTILSGLLALVSLDLMSKGWTLLPIVPFAMCTFLLIAHVGIDNWKNFFIENQNLSIASCRLLWSRHEIHNRDEAWRHNEEVSGFLITLYGGARAWFILGMLAMPIAAIQSSSAPPTSDASAQESASVPQKVAHRPYDVPHGIQSSLEVRLPAV